MASKEAIRKSKHLYSDQWLICLGFELSLKDGVDFELALFHSTFATVQFLLIYCIYLLERSKRRDEIVS